jgi:transcriptional regulator with XRE-family HTH domain
MNKNIKDEIKSEANQNCHGDNVISIIEQEFGLGSEIRQMRKARKLTLKTLSDLTGISVSHISAIERGATNPSLSVMKDIASALKIDPNWFFVRRAGKGIMERAFVVRKHNRRKLNMLYNEDADSIGLTDELLSSSVGGNLFMGMANFKPYSSREKHKLYKHEGEQHGLVVKGKIELQISDEIITLEEGDSYSLPTHLIHKANNMTDQPAQLIWVISPIVFPNEVVINNNKNQDEEELRDNKTMTNTGT